MSGATGQEQSYCVPSGVLGLLGPVEKPAPGTLPLRGDLAHIVLAGQHLAAHYVIPQIRTVGDTGAQLLLMPREDADLIVHLQSGESIEVLDIEGQWIWACVGPEGPSGYCDMTSLAPETTES